MAEVKSEDDVVYKKKMSEMGHVLPHLYKSDVLSKLCTKIIKGLIIDYGKNDFKSLNDNKLSTKCSSNEYISLSNFLKFIGFKRKIIKNNDNNNIDISNNIECRWIFEGKSNGISIELLECILNEMKRNILKTKLSQNNVCQLFPKNAGILQLSNLKLWSISQNSVNNFWNRGTNWGNYQIRLIFMNVFSFPIHIFWINYGGKIRENPTIVHPNKSVTIFSELSHPHIIKNGYNNELICGYNPKSRGNINGIHIILCGQYKGNINSLISTLINKAPKDTRSPPKMGPPPAPPRPEDRRGKFWGGR